MLKQNLKFKKIYFNIQKTTCVNIKNSTILKNLKKFDKKNFKKLFCKKFLIAKKYKEIVIDL